MALRASLWIKKNNLVNRIFRATTDERDEAFLAACVLRKCFRVVNALLQNDNEEGKSGEEVLETPGKIIMSYSIGDIDVRRTLVEFDRCFLSGSVACGGLRGVHYVPVSVHYSEELYKFGMCNRGGTNICRDCKKILLVACNTAEGILWTAGRLAQAIASAGSSIENLLSKGFQNLSH